MVGTPPCAGDQAEGRLAQTRTRMAGTMGRALRRVLLAARKFCPEFTGYRGHPCPLLAARRLRPAGTPDRDQQRRARLVLRGP
jgi:hypothetical protein